MNNVFLLNIGIYHFVCWNMFLRYNGRTDLNPRLTGLAVRVALPLVSTSQSGRTETDVSIPVPHEPAAESAQSLPKDPKDPSK